MKKLYLLLALMMLCSLVLSAVPVMATGFGGADFKVDDVCGKTGIPDTPWVKLFLVSKADRKITAWTIYKTWGVEYKREPVYNPLPSITFTVTGLSQPTVYEYYYQCWIANSVIKQNSNGTWNYNYGEDGIFTTRMPIPYTNPAQTSAKVTFNISLGYWEKFLFERRQIPITSYVFRYWKSNHTIDNTWQAYTSDKLMFGRLRDPNGAWNSGTNLYYHFLFIGNANPPHLTRNGGDLILTKGFSFETSYTTGNVDDKAPVYLFVTDATPNRNLIGWASYDSYQSVDTEHPLQVSIPGLLNQIRLNTFKKLYYTVNTAKLRLSAQTGYYVYLGVPNPQFNDGSTYNSKSIAITLDSTVKAKNFSVTTSGNQYTGTSCVRELWNTTAPNQNEFLGCMLYIETFPSSAKKTGTTSNKVAFMAPFVAWCNAVPPSGAGLPFLPTIFGFLIPIILVGLLYNFMRRYEVSLPNYLYTLPVVGGTYLSYIIGLLELWVLVFIVAMLVFIALYRFREPISLAMQTVAQSRMGSALSAGERRERRTEIAGESGRVRIGKMKDEGVRLPAPRPTGSLTRKGSYTERKIGNLTARQITEHDVKTGKSRSRAIITRNKGGK